CISALWMYLSRCISALPSLVADLLHLEEEVPADLLPARLSPRHHDLQLVGRGQVRGRGSGLLYRDAELVCPQLHVPLLRSGGAGARSTEVSVVEAIPDHPAA
ncbi:hypothetical protein GDO81_030137, partial [Engystomops pustulosus]